MALPGKQIDPDCRARHGELEAVFFVISPLCESAKGTLSRAGALIERHAWAIFNDVGGHPGE